MPDRLDMSKTGTFRISSPRLEIELAYPGSAVQKGARFDLTGHVIQATLDARHVFCAPESQDESRGSGGLGLCNEFMDATKSIYGQAKPGEAFPKIGVGLVTRDDENDYRFMKHYDKKLYPMEVHSCKDTAEFTVQPSECLGYAAKLNKKLTVRDRTLSIEYTLENTGRKRLELREYNHNFVCIDGKAIGPDYRVKLPYDITMAKLDMDPNILAPGRRDITWKGVPEGPFICKITGADRNEPHKWELVHEPSGVGMSETDNIPLADLILWGTGHVVSLEAIVFIGLNPGEKMSWTRKYEFFC